MTAIDTLVIGGGITGTVAAIALAKQGARVTVLDAGTNAGSDANAGSLHVQMQSRFMRLYPDQVPNVEASLPFYREAAEEWARLDEQLGGLDLIREGGLMLAESHEQLAFLEAKAARESSKGLSVEILDRSALDAVAPWLGRQIVGAELCKDEGKLNPLIANAKLQALAKQLGVERHTACVRRIEVQTDGIEAITSKGVFRADQSVLAAAWGSGDLVAPFGITIPSKAEPLHMNITEAGAPAIHHLVQHAERSITLKQFGSGQIVIGGGWPAKSRGKVNPPSVQSFSLLGNVALAAKLVPGITGLRIIRTWAGMNTTTDGASVVGRLPQSERIVMAIPGDAGYTLGPLVGRMAAEIAHGQTPTMDIERFSPDRFAA
ncbi:FAD-binding oxidoreductase [Ahrensia marina]|uniref:NAD(P)/FAD-dependent oxidoreductase n=1 Tax=Ahrensia marina TaxID=1514904 RepID=UPI0035CF127F